MLALKIKFKVNYYNKFINIKIKLISFKIYYITQVNNP